MTAVQTPDDGGRAAISLASGQHWLRLRAFADAGPADTVPKWGSRSIGSRNRNSFAELMHHDAGKKPGGSEDSMHRTKLGLFGTSRPAANADNHQSHDRTLPAEHLELLAGLTPVERATAEAMLRSNAIAA